MFHYMTDFVFSFDWVKPSKYLLIDDDPVYCDLMTKVASQHNIDLTCCTNSKSLEKIDGNLQGFNFEIAILDYDFSIATGLELAKYLAARNQNLPCVLVSAGSLDHIKRRPMPRNVRALSDKSIGALEVLRVASRFAKAS